MCGPTRPFYPAVRRLSPELLGRIFSSIGIPELADPDGRHVLVDFRAQMLPSHICSDWRNVALSTPSLWSRFRLEMDEWYADSVDMESLTALVTTWLGRTHGYPLAFVLEGYQFGPVLAALLPFCENWEDVSIKIPHYMFNHLTPIKGHLPRLKSLKISERGGGEFPFATSFRPLSTRPIHFFEEASKLRHVDIISSWVVVVLRLPLGELTKCSLLGCTIERCLNILKHCLLSKEFEVFLDPSFGEMRRPSQPRLLHSPFTSRNH